MNKRRTVGLIVLVVLIVILLIVRLLITGWIVGGSPVYTLAEPALGVITNIGIKNLAAGTKIGGEPTDYILLGETRIFITTQGERTIGQGEKIHCEVDPGEPDPCDPYAE